MAKILLEQPKYKKYKGYRQGAKYTRIEEYTKEQQLCNTATRPAAPNTLKHT
jgi:hypothetical protein